MSNRVVLVLCVVEFFCGFMAGRADAREYLPRTEAVQTAEKLAASFPRPGYSVIRTYRVSPWRVRLRWVDDPYLEDCPDRGRCFDVGYDIAQRWGKHTWIRDGQAGGQWTRVK